MQLEYNGDALSVAGSNKIIGYVAKQPAGGTWGHYVSDGRALWQVGFRTRFDATVALLLQLGGRHGAPKTAEVYKMIIEVKGSLI